MSEREIACPKCRDAFMIEGDVTTSPQPGKIPLVRCPACGNRAGLAAFDGEIERQTRERQKRAERQIADERRAREREQLAKASAIHAEAKAKEREEAERAEQERRRVELERKQVEYEELDAARQDVYVVDESRDPMNSGFAAVFGGLGSILCWWAGCYLLDVQAQARDSIFESIATGMGIYCIGQGFIVGPLVYFAALQSGSRRIGNWQALRRLRKIEDQMLPEILKKEIALDSPVIPGAESQNRRVDTPREHTHESG